MPGKAVPDKVFADVIPLVHESGISVPYSWWAGATASRFFSGLRDEQKIYGTRCASCQKVFLPPRKTCPTCFTPNEQWVELGPEGTLVAFTVARRQLAALPHPAPIIFGLIKLDGASTAILHHLGGIAPDQVKIGMRLKTKFAPNRTGAITDIACFIPA